MNKAADDLARTLFNDALDEFELDQAEIHELDPERDLMFPQEGRHDDDD
jgi:hypothetical protein